ncbi:hypothetical protein [Rhizobium sp. P44RR-XXIV]|uniref:hypothetical protein n=1 Tax=Rhizobium sp. P44RR-XXIV TaxID=1921145 RepID=UPI0009873BAF|nr:hypothetical protein [Rhizobium sp. P44RR-XXIV]TIX89286.1 hypothetical protein BSK43_022075 [Rhizobium sp. P44RR-XXIV]
MPNTNNRFMELVDREMRAAGDQWMIFTLTRTADAWRAYVAANRRARIVAVSLGIDFPMPKPILRVQAHREAA